MELVDARVAASNPGNGTSSSDTNKEQGEMA